MTNIPGARARARVLPGCERAPQRPGPAGALVPARQADHRPGAGAACGRPGTRRLGRARRARGARANPGRRAAGVVPNRLHAALPRAAGCIGARLPWPNSRPLGRSRLGGQRQLARGRPPDLGNTEAAGPVLATGARRCGGPNGRRCATHSAQRGAARARPPATACAALRDARLGRPLVPRAGHRAARHSARAAPHPRPERAGRTGARVAVRRAHRACAHARARAAGAAAPPTDYAFPVSSAADTLAR